MSEYKYQQCPECGCERFKSATTIGTFLKFTNNGFGGHVFEFDNREYSTPITNCANCDTQINETVINQTE